MEAVQKRTGELRVATSDDIEQARLFGGFAAVSIYELSVTGATGFPGDDALTLGDEVVLTIRGRVVKLTQEVRIDKKTDDESLVRVAVVKAAHVKVTR